MLGARHLTSEAGAGPRDFRSRRRRSRPDLTLPGSRPSGGFDVLGGRGTFLLRPGGGSSEHPRFLVNVIYQVDTKKVVSIPSGKYGFLNAKDGAPLRPDQFLAETFPAEHVLDMLDAEHFLTHGGQRGPQTTVLTPGNYRLNTYLWDLSVF